MPEEKRHVVPLDGRTERWNFGLIELLVAICVALVGWNLTATIKLKDGMIKASAVQLALGLRVEHLEDEKDLGDRFTAADGNTLRVEIMHNRTMQLNHNQRTEQKIESIHNAVVNRITQ